MRRRASGSCLLLLIAACAAPPRPVLSAPAAPAAATPVVPAEIKIEGLLSQGGAARGVAPVGTVRLTIDGKTVEVAGDRTFLIGFDRDQPASALLAATLADGRTVARTLAVAPRAWAIERIDAPLRPTRSTEEFLRIRQGELARINAARAADTGSEGWRQRFAWPATGRISGRFGAQRVYRGEAAAYHSGVDVAPGAGAPVVAPADGVVVLAGPPAFSLEGNLVIVDHGMGLNSAFLHLATVAVRQGQKVRQGQAIGTVGATGRATGPHLHWSLKWNDARLDPELLAGPMPR